MELLPSVMGVLTLGAETTSSSRTMAISLLLSWAARVVMSAQIRAPWLSIAKETATSLVIGAGAAGALRTCSPDRAASGLARRFLMAYRTYRLVNFPVVKSRRGSAPQRNWISEGNIALISGLSR